MMMAHREPELVLGAQNSDWDSMAEMMGEMMWPYKVGLGRVFWQFHWILEVITWVLIIALLVALVRWLWKKGDKVK